MPQESPGAPCSGGSHPVGGVVSDIHQVAGGSLRIVAGQRLAAYAWGGTQRAARGGHPVQSRLSLPGPHPVGGYNYNWYMTSSRHITTSEQLDALPDGTLVRDDNGDFALKRPSDGRIGRGKDGYVWQVLGDDRTFGGELDLSRSEYLRFPAQVLWPVPA